MRLTEKKIYEFLPAIYRIRDEQLGGPLKALIEIISEEAINTEKDITQLFNNWFIETCEEWVVPYIGDMLGVRNFHALTGSSGLSQRAYIANTLSYRRRKGIAPVLEQLSLDISGWRSHVVECFELLSASQYMNHIRTHRPLTPDLRNMNQLDLLDTAFDTIAHSVDVRHISSGRGRYNIPNLGLFIWRLQNYPVVRSTARMVKCPFSSPTDILNYFTFDPLGRDCQLFNNPVTEKTITHISEEINVPVALRRRALFDELEERRKANGDESSIKYRYFDDRETIDGESETKKHPVFEIFPNNEKKAVRPDKIMICSLKNCCKLPSCTDGSIQDMEKQISVVVDPVLGRFIFTDPDITKAKVSYSYGFSGDVGAGPFSRETPDLENFTKDITWHVGVSKNIDVISNETIFKSLTGAINNWNSQPAGTVGLISIMDSCTYQEDIIINIPKKSKLMIIAAGWPVRYNPNLNMSERYKGDISPGNIRPHLYGYIHVRGLPKAEMNVGGCLILNGLLLEGNLSVLKGNLNELTIEFCTILPRKGGLVIGNGVSAENTNSNQWLKVRLQHTITGPLLMNTTRIESIEAEDSIIDNGENEAINALNAPTSLVSSTVIGRTHVKSMEASNSIFVGEVIVERRQTGCIRFCFVPGFNPKTPRRFRCQPDLEIVTLIAEAEKKGPLSEIEKKNIEDGIRDWLFPGFTSTIFGHQSYAQLSSECPVQITTGADDGSEMGAFNFLKQPQRMANLHLALEEYLPLGMKAGIIYVT